MKTIQGKTLDLDNLKNGLFAIREGLVSIGKKEEGQKAKDFKKGFLRLISSVELSKERGLWRKTYFNLFETLGCQRLEIVHSNMLTWLLNPEEAHGLGDKFLRKFVRRIFNKELPSYLPVEIKRESQDGKNRVDIVVEGKNWWLVIENKIGSGEQDGQTEKYAEYYRRKGIIRENVFLVFLRPTGVEPKSHYFTPVSYQTIRELLENMNFQGNSNVLIRHFIDHIFLDLEDEYGR